LGRPARAGRFELRAGDRRLRPMIWTVFVVLFALWLLGFFAFHVGGGLIHLLLLGAVAALVLGVVRRGS